MHSTQDLLVHSWPIKRIIPLFVFAVTLIICLWILTPSPASTGGPTTNSIVLCVTLTRIPDALGLLKEEHSRVTAERDAFNQFARQVADLDLDTPTPTESPPVGPQATTSMAGSTASQTQQNDSMQTVQECYRETVMAVPHYTEDYDESFAENITNEFGPDLAEAVTNTHALSPHLQNALVTASQQARDERRTLVKAVATEQEHVRTAKRSLQESEDRVSTIEDAPPRRSFSALIADWKRLADIETKCRRLLRERQAQLQNPSGSWSPLTLQSYLYAPPQWTYPVLGDGLDCLTHITRAKQEVLDVIAGKA